ncbi:hypothetical protein M569_05893, partial [Genlisea aurea]
DGGFSEEESTQLDELLKLCDALDEPGNRNPGVDEESGNGFLICCPLCGCDISALSDDRKQIHTNGCLDKLERSSDVSSYSTATDVSHAKLGTNAPGLSPIGEWLSLLGLAKYEEVFLKHEVDLEALQWITEEDLCSLGITLLGPRKKILHAINSLRNDAIEVAEAEPVDETKSVANKLITDYFAHPLSVRNRGRVVTIEKKPHSVRKAAKGKENFRNSKQKDVPSWCRIPGTPFRVDAFKYLRRDCSHWFLTHFHLDHYQGLTKSFCHGKIYCSSITAKLVHLKIGIPMESIEVLPINRKINVAGVDITCFNANHCPGAVMILFEPTDGTPVLHTGDFRFCENMKDISALKTRSIHTLILDTTYCNAQYDFPKQESVIQFVIDAIQAETFNSKTLFLIGSYTIGRKERLFLEVARVLQKKIHVSASKLRILECLELGEEDMKRFTLDEGESCIHVVPMWVVASFKRLKQMASSRYTGSRFNSIVSFSPTGWSFGQGRRSMGKKLQQGTIIRYEVPYSEHSSFTELKEFVKMITPERIIPSVNDDHGLDSLNPTVSELLS